jgi:hypothetical protein
MKKKTLLVLAIAGLTTLSFTFSNIERKKGQSAPSVKITIDAPVGGFIDNSVEK